MPVAPLVALIISHTLKPASAFNLLCLSTDQKGMTLMGTLAGNQSEQSSPDMAASKRDSQASVARLAENKYEIDLQL